MSALQTYLVGIMYHEPKGFSLWKRGVIEDYESSEGVLIDAASPEEAVAWGEVIGEAVLRHLNPEDFTDWKELYFAWIEDPAGMWSHALPTFQHVRVGELPDLNKFSHE